MSTHQKLREPKSQLVSKQKFTESTMLIFLEVSRNVILVVTQLRFLYAGFTIYWCWPFPLINPPSAQSFAANYGYKQWIENLNGWAKFVVLGIRNSQVFNFAADVFTLYKSLVLNSSNTGGKLKFCTSKSWLSSSCCAAHRWLSADASYSARSFK